MAEASIVFRDKNMSSTGKIYVDHMDSASRLAAIYRNASFYVDVINRRDEVAYRWEAGVAVCGGESLVKITRGSDAFDFVRPHDPFWSPENQILLLHEALRYAFDIATGQENQNAFESLLLRTESSGDEVWNLVREARIVREKACLFTDRAKWAQHILNWMQDSQGLFLDYRIEYAALSINSNLFIPSNRVASLEVELVYLELEISQRDAC